MAAEGVAAQRGHKREVLAAVHRVLSIHLGAPPQRFLWQWEDRNREFHRDGRLTPAEFAAAYVRLPLDEYVCLVHDPRDSSPVGRTFTVEYCSGRGRAAAGHRRGRPAGWGSRGEHPVTR
ncbi:C1 family peptidase [Streptomyces tricolor]|uniref:C1 family peptidase n=1 Tax=Streptomyces tricolor TaxID=68277 RepID=UPI0036E256E6